MELKSAIALLGTGRTLNFARQTLREMVVPRSAKWLLGLVALASPSEGQGVGGFTDAHVHLNDPAAWLAQMEAFGIDRAIVFRGRDIDNAGLLAAARQHPGTLIPFLSVSPEHQEYRARWQAGDLSLVALADSMLAGGEFRGIGEISVSHFPGAGFPEADFDPNGPVMRGLLEAARRHRVPVTMHVEVTRLREFEALLERFPDVTVIWAHGGYTPVYLAERLLNRFPNLVYELSARTWADHPRSADYTILKDGQAVWPQWLALVERMPERFLVGTDAALRSVSSDREKIASVHNFLGQLSPAARRLVAYGNLDRILPVDR